MPLAFRFPVILRRTGDLHGHADFGAGTVTGAVVFAANNLPLNTNTLSGGVALANYSLDPADTDVIVVRYVYTFEGNAQDSSGNVIHGTATSVSYVTGKFRVLVP